MPATTPASPKELAIFGLLCSDLSGAGWVELRGQVVAYLAELEAAQAKSEMLAVDVAAQICERLEHLFDLGNELPAAQRVLVIGAARYFLSKDDAIPDTRACTGLDDDVRIVNHVLKELGRSEWSIEE